MIIKIPTESPELVEVSYEHRHKYSGVAHKIIDDNLETRKNKVIEMMSHAWTNYKLYAWGKNELNSIEKTSNNNSIFGRCEIGATIVDALDTLYLMDLTKEYEEARNWIAQSFSLDECDEYISVFELNIRFIGGFLSLYALTGDLLYQEKAKYVADKITPVFDTPSGVPYSKINIYSGRCDEGLTVIADCGTLSLEFRYLSEITNDASYVTRITKINEVLRTHRLPNGLHPFWIDPNTGEYVSDQVSFGANADSFYEYLLKSWIQSKDDDMKEWLEETIDAVVTHLVKQTKHGLYYITGQFGNFSEHKMEHLACFAGGFFALASNSSIYQNSSQSERLLILGKELTKTCHESYVMTKTGLGPELMSFHPVMQETKAITALDRSFKLRPETVESYFYLWRITHEQKYRDWAWDVVQALEKYCRVPYGYTGINDVYLQNTGYDGVQQSFFVAETLKYLYLIFSDDDVLHLNEWVFNTEAHPLPIL